MKAIYSCKENGIQAYEFVSNEGKTIKLLRVEVPKETDSATLLYTVNNELVEGDLSRHNSTRLSLDRKKVLMRFEGDNEHKLYSLVGLVRRATKRAKDLSYAEILLGGR